MGYTHYWSIKKPDSKDMSKAMKDMSKICKSYSSILAGPDGTGKPIISSSEISINGIDDDSHETFHISASAKNVQDFCKTAQKPYDECVVACLAALKDCCKNQVSIGSDGGNEALNDGASTASKILGRGVKISAALQQLKASVHKIIADPIPKNMIRLNLTVSLNGKPVSIDYLLKNDGLVVLSSQSVFNIPSYNTVKQYVGKSNVPLTIYLHNGEEIKTRTNISDGLTEGNHILLALDDKTLKSLE